MPLAFGILLLYVTEGEELDMYLPRHASTLHELTRPRQRLDFIHTVAIAAYAVGIY